MKTIGIIGGAGPMASCQLYKLIIEECQQHYGCKADADFPRMIIINYPFADMLTVKAREQNRQLLTQQLQACCDQLAAQEAGVIAIACNTLHTILPDIVIPPSCKLVHIAQVTLARVQDLGIKRLLILATSTTAQLQLYRTPNVDCVSPIPKDQLVVDQVIANILTGKLTIKDSHLLSAVVNQYAVDGVVLGCTELPLLHEQYPFCTNDPMPFFNTLSVLADVVVERVK